MPRRRYSATTAPCPVIQNGRMTSSIASKDILETVEVSKSTLTLKHEETIATESLVHLLCRSVRSDGRHLFQTETASSFRSISTSVSPFLTKAGSDSVANLWFYNRPETSHYFIPGCKRFLKSVLIDQPLFLCKTERIRQLETF